ncbi:MAG: cell wall-associated hydrolase, invasion-associated protein [Candidatus Frackibacter sp. T328-2]|nr:MAG: cell wall-associated hydrolase, invasion-associated protein [Candidatus Frackibacter sp. T328-2]
MKEVIRKHVGKPYRHNGRNLNGLDCLGLVVSFLRDNNIYLPDDDGKFIPEDWYKDDPERFINGLKQYGKKVEINDRQPLDVVVFSFKGIPKHAGVMISRSRFIHARRGKKVAVIRLKHYKKFFHSLWRIRGE